MRDAAGAWQTVIAEVGIPVGRPQTITLDLADRWLSSDRQVRIVTNMRIYWDEVRVAAAADSRALRVTTVDPATADLRDRGFSHEHTRSAPQRTTFDYTKVTAESPWKAFPGRYTRLGDVRELLRDSDDVFVFSKPGDELAVSFDAAAFPPLRAGMQRTFLLLLGWLQQGDGHQLRHPRPVGAAAVPRHVALPLRRPVSASR